MLYCWLLTLLCRLLVSCFGAGYDPQFSLQSILFVLQFDQGLLDTLRHKQGFRSDGVTYANKPGTPVSLMTATLNLERSNDKLVVNILQIFRANMGVPTDNWRATNNALLVLDKIKTVSCCMLHCNCDCS